jgi:lysozyme family protein
VADLNKAILYVFRNEDRKMTGAVTTDRGGKTRFGVAQKFHPDMDPSFYTCPAWEALAQAQQLYKNVYCSPLLIGKITFQPIANKLLDIGVNCGVDVATRMAQTGVTNLGVPVAIDEHMGPATVAAVNKVDATKLMSQLIVQSQDHYRQVAADLKASPDEIASWLTRASKPGV